jgi:SNF2 family DNA or RNA helicase
VSISGAIPARQRTKIIEQFKNDPTINVLIMSVVGQTGLNLTWCRVMVLYVSAFPFTHKHISNFLATGDQEATWSGVQAQQIHGRINRRGQTLPTFIFQLFAADTVEVLLLANGLGKHQLLSDFLKLQRNEGKIRLFNDTRTICTDHNILS